MECQKYYSFKKASYIFIILWNALWCWRIFLSAFLWSGFMGNACTVLILSYCWMLTLESHFMLSAAVNYWLGDTLLSFSCMVSLVFEGHLKPCWWLLKCFFPAYLWIFACMYYVHFCAVIHIWVNDSLFGPFRIFLISVVILTVLWTRIFKYHCRLLFL